jgi:hypothetical protein
MPVIGEMKHVIFSADASNLKFLTFQHFLHIYDLSQTFV